MEKKINIDIAMDKAKETREMKDINSDEDYKFNQTSKMPKEIEDNIRYLHNKNQEDEIIKYIEECLTWAYKVGAYRQKELMEARQMENEKK